MPAHIPYGYIIVGGRPVIDPERSEQIRTLFASFLSGKSYIASAKGAGLDMNHASAKNILKNRRYLGNDYYPQIIDEDTFDKAQKLIERKASAIGDRNRKTHEAPIPKTKFYMQRADVIPDNPFKKAEYLYGLIESEAERDAKRKNRNSNTSTKEGIEVCVRY